MSRIAAPPGTDKRKRSPRIEKVEAGQNRSHREPEAPFEERRATRRIGTTPASVQKILAIATDAIGNEDKAWRWLHGQSLQLRNRRPIDVVGTAKGFRAVEIILNQIKYGAYA